MATKSKKQLMDEADPLDSGQQKAQALQSGSLSLHEVDAKVYGGSSVRIPPSGRQTAEPIALDAITPDPTQPRREVPLTVRRKAREHGMAEWLVWYQMAEKMAGREIPLTALLRGEGEASEAEVTGQPLVDSFLSLVALAASINREGLTNAITVTARGIDRYQIETGERRYQAFRLLYGALNEEKFARIAARVETKSDVWKQASENGSRKPLNAIGMARQLALLVMELYRGKDGADFVPFDKIVQDGDCDRVFYAQVADGNIWRIPKGTSERILQATGLKSKRQIAQYRALLDVSDEVWMQADEDDWAEGRIRELMHPTQDRSTIVDLSPRNGNPSLQLTHQKESHLVAPNGPITYPLTGTGQRFMLYRGQRVQLERSVLNGPNGLHMKVWHLDEDERTYSETVPVTALREIGTPSPASPFGNPRPALTAPQPSLIVGGKYRTADGKLYEVVGLQGNSARVAPLTPSTLQRMPGTFQTINAYELLPLKQDTFDADQARLDIMGPDDKDEPRLVDRQEEMLIGIYYGLYYPKNAATRGGLEDKQMIRVTDRENWSAVVTPKGLAYLEQYELAPNPPSNNFVTGDWVLIRGSEQGRVLKTEGVYALINTGSTKGDWVHHDYLRLDPAKVDSPEAAPTDLMEAMRQSREGTAAPGDDIALNIYQHYKTGALYRITGVDVIGRMTARLANEQGGKISAIDETFEKGDLILYQRVYAHLPQTETSIESMDEGEEDETEGGRTPNQASVNPLPTQQPPLPDWASNGRLVTDVQRGLPGKVISAYWSASKNVWMVRVGFEDHTSTIPLDLLAAHEAEILNDLPAWAVTGAPAMHMGGDACEIVQCIYDVASGQWLLKVLILSSGVEDTAPLDDFMPMAAQVPTIEPVAPREPHPALRQRSGVIIEEQRMLRHLSDTALAFGMKTEAAALASLPVSTANHILTQLNTSGKQSVIEQADREYQMAYAVYMRGIEIAYQVRANKILVAEDLEAEQQK